MIRFTLCTPRDTWAMLWSSRVSRLEAPSVRPFLPGAVNLITWSRYCLISTLYYLCYLFCLATEIFKTTQIFYSLTKFPPIFRICWSSLPDPILTMTTAKWWFSNSSILSHSLHIYSLASAFYCNSPPSSPIHVPLSFNYQYEFINSDFFRWFYNSLLYLTVFLLKLSQMWQAGAFQTGSYVLVICPHHLFQ